MFHTNMKHGMTFFVQNTLISFAILFGDGIINNVSKLPQVALEPIFCFDDKPEVVFLRFDTTKRCAISCFLVTVL